MLDLAKKTLSYILRSRGERGDKVRPKAGGGGEVNSLRVYIVNLLFHLLLIFHIYFLLITF